MAAMKPFGKDLMQKMNEELVYLLDMLDVQRDVMTIRHTQLMETVRVCSPDNAVLLEHIQQIDAKNNALLEIIKSIDKHLKAVKELRKAISRLQHCSAV